VENTLTVSELRQLFNYNVDTNSDCHDGLKCSGCVDGSPWRAYRAGSGGVALQRASRTSGSALYNNCHRNGAGSGG
jgi:hypothetical protein